MHLVFVCIWALAPLLGFPSWFVGPASNWSVFFCCTLTAFHLLRDFTCFSLFCSFSCRLSRFHILFLVKRFHCWLALCFFRLHPLGLVCFSLLTCICLGLGPLNQWSLIIDQKKSTLLLCPLSSIVPKVCDYYIFLLS